MKNSNITLLQDKGLLKVAFWDSLKKFNPKYQIKNPVMFIVFIGALITGIIFISNVINGHFSSFELQLNIWFWFTILFANFAEAIAEGRGKAQADSLKGLKTDVKCKKIVDNKIEFVTANTLKVGDIVLCEVNDIIPSDGEVIEGVAGVDESAITGESATVIRESGGDRCSVTGGTLIISDSIKIKITAEQGNTFIDKMISLVEGAKRKKTPNEIALTILLSGLTLILLIAVATLLPFGNYIQDAAKTHLFQINITSLTALLICLIPTTIGALLSAIGISGMERLLSKNVIAKSGRSIEAAGDVNVLLLDKTGTITFGNRMASNFFKTSNVQEDEMIFASAISSLSDQTPEGRSIVDLATKQGFKYNENEILNAEFIEFTAQTRMSGINFEFKGKNFQIRKGAADSIRTYVLENNGIYSDEVDKIVREVSSEGATPLVVASNFKVMGVIKLKDVVKPGIRERFDGLRKMGIRTVMITGDNPLTAAAIAAESGVDDFLAEAKPEQKLDKIRAEQNKGYLVAMIGDGTNDAPALAQADIGVAMNSGTQAAKEAGNMIDLDSDPTKLIEVVETGKQLLMTRGALTTFSIANDVAKYFAILPAIFAGLFVSSSKGSIIESLNLMGLQSAESAILSAVIFNAIIIVFLIPIALRGVPYKPMGATAILKKNLFIYGLGGLILPFVGIKLIDIIINFLHLV
jgi:K+-transporting ATPase ATPase B chain